MDVVPPPTHVIASLLNKNEFARARQQQDEGQIGVVPPQGLRPNAFVVVLPRIACHKQTSNTQYEYVSPPPHIAGQPLNAAQRLDVKQRKQRNEGAIQRADGIGAFADPPASCLSTVGHPCVHKWSAMGRSTDNEWLLESLGQTADMKKPIFNHMMSGSPSRISCCNACPL